MSAAALAQVLGGQSGVGHQIHSDVDLALAVEAGLTPAAVEHLAEAMSLSAEDFDRLLMPKRTLRYRREHQQKLTAAESDRAAIVGRVWIAAVDTFGNQDKASRWLRQPNRALKGHTPFDLLDTGSGAQVVVQVLGRIAHGIFE